MRRGIIHMLTAAAATIAIAHHPALTAHSFSTIHGSGMLPPVAARNRCSFYTAVIACVSRLWHVASSCCIAFIAHICYAATAIAYTLQRLHPIDQSSRTRSHLADQGSRPRSHLTAARCRDDRIRAGLADGITAATASDQGSRT